MKMTLPCEIWKYILRIKSYTAWQLYLLKIHTHLSLILNHEKTVIFWQRQTTVHIYKHRIFEIVVEENPNSIYIMRKANRSIPTEYILRESVQ